MDTSVRVSDITRTSEHIEATVSFNITNEIALLHQVNVSVRLDLDQADTSLIGIENRAIEQACEVLSGLVSGSRSVRVQYPR